MRLTAICAAMAVATVMSCAAPDAVREVSEGSGLDPYGHKSPSQGSIIDPNGGKSASEGSSMDPFGRSASEAPLLDQRRISSDAQATYQSTKGSGREFAE
jgi:hypothetical protein